MSKVFRESKEDDSAPVEGWRSRQTQLRTQEEQSQPELGSVMIVTQSLTLVVVVY